MFLFEEVDGATVLYTGDMRADKEMMLRFRREPAFSRLSVLHLDELFIDVAGYGLIEDQPTRCQCLMTLTDMILDRQEADYLIACDRFGYEKFVSELALRLHLYIAMSDRQLEICRLLQLDRAFVATDDPEVKIRVDRSANVRKRMAQDSEAGYFTKAIYLDRDDYTPPRKKSLCSERSIVVHYACHSTRNELHRFIQRLQFKRLSPLNGKLTEQEMTELLSLGQVPQPIRDEQLTIPACFKRIIDQYDSHSASRIIAECGSWNSLTRDEDDWVASLLGGPSIADTTTAHQNEQSRPPVGNSDTSTNEDTATEPEEEEAAEQLNEAAVLSSKITDSDRDVWLAFIEYITVTNAK